MTQQPMAELGLVLVIPTGLKRRILDTTDEYCHFNEHFYRR